jgi:hypothetical protein
VSSFVLNRLLNLHVSLWTLKSKYQSVSSHDGLNITTRWYSKLPGACPDEKGVSWLASFLPVPVMKTQFTYHGAFYKWRAALLTLSRQQDHPVPIAYRELSGQVPQKFASGEKLPA